jgi:hypothetical protein
MSGCNITGADDKSFDWTSVFTEGRVKAQIQLGDPNVGRTPRPTLQLISTCSALLLRKLVQESKGRARQRTLQSTASTTEVLKGDRKKLFDGSGLGDNSQILVLSAKDILESVRNNESLAFLHDALEQATNADNGNLASQNKGKRKKMVTDNDKPSKKRAPRRLAGGNIIGSDAMEQALQISQEQGSVNNAAAKITLDEEEYD